MSLSVTDMLAAALEILTLALVLITAFYAWQTKRLSQLTNNAVEPTRLAEETRLRPHVHVTGISCLPRASREPPDHFDLDLSVQIRNMGHGAAINIVGALDNAQMSLSQSSGPANLCGDGDAGDLVFSASAVPALARTSSSRTTRPETTRGRKPSAWGNTR